MMGLSDAGYYLAVFVFYMTWTIIPSVIFTYVLYAPQGKYIVPESSSVLPGWGFGFLDRFHREDGQEPIDSGIGNFETIFPGSNFMYLWWICWGNMFQALLQTLWCGCFTDRR